MFSDDWTSIVDRVAEHIHHTPDEGLAYRHLHDAAGALDEIAFANGLKLAEQHRTDLVFFEIERKTTHVVRKLEQFAGHHLFKAVQLRDPVANLDDGSDFSNGHAGIEVLDLFANNVVDFAGSNWFHDLVL